VVEALGGTQTGSQGSTSQDGCKPTTSRTVNGTLVRDPFTFGGHINVIDPARFSSVSKNIIPLIPEPELPGVLNNYLLLSGFHNPNNQVAGKVDHLFNEKHRMSGYYLREAFPWDSRYLDVRNAEEHRGRSLVYQTSALFPA
jgi:hypothetical protein